MPVPFLTKIRPKASPEARAKYICFYADECNETGCRHHKPHYREFGDPCNDVDCIEDRGECSEYFCEYGCFDDVFCVTIQKEAKNAQKR